MSNEVKELLITFEEWIQFVQSLQDQSEEFWHSSIEAGKWTTKDIVCHIMLWDKFFYEEAIHKIASGKSITLKHTDYDEFNNKAVVYAKTITISELVGETVSYRDKIGSAIRVMPEEIINQNFKDGDGNDFNVTQYLKDFIWHDQHHMNQITSLR
ncbi:DinB family protein [Paenibacillus vini]|uniref:DinB family protein n=1 Tax=Paenibacillus vini TaxID=1476024 RepID=UPI0025B6F613|nr:DinB family protein [Paenibacillus vini]MDN4071327.1 DinB family protein [Paenibacillus vini]